MENNMLNELILSEDLNVMEEKLKNNYYKAYHLNDHALFLNSYLEGKNKSIAFNKSSDVKLIDVYNDLRKYCESELSCGFEPFSFNVALFEELKEYQELYRLKYFEDIGWVVLIIKGQCAWSDWY
jgi:hypothetical protein